MKKQIQSTLSFAILVFVSLFAKIGAALEFESASHAAGYVHSQKFWNKVYVERCSAQLPHEKEALSEALSNWIKRNRVELNAAESLFITHTYNNADLIEAAISTATLKANESFSSIPPDERRNTCEIFLRQTANGDLDIKAITPKASALLIAYAKSNSN